jgi:hypothetical protein
MTETGDRLRLLFDWASAQQGGRRLALWIIVAVLLHGAAYVLCRVTYPSPSPTRISDATLYVLLPNSAEARSLAPFLAAADPALFAPEASHGAKLVTPPIPAYEPSYAVAKPQLEPLPDVQPRVLPPLLRDLGPVAVADAPVTAAPQPVPADDTQVLFSESLQGRLPKQRPKVRFVARPGDQLAPMRFLIAVAPDGRVLHVVRDSDPSGITPGDDNKAMDEAAARFLNDLWFQRGPDSNVTWGTATFYWGLDVKREELR